jgi:hypothetical protein
VAAPSAWIPWEDGKSLLLGQSESGRDGPRRSEALATAMATQGECQCDENRRIAFRRCAETAFPPDQFVPFCLKMGVSCVVRVNDSGPNTYDPVRGPGAAGHGHL